MLDQEHFLKLQDTRPRGLDVGMVGLHQSVMAGKKYPRRETGTLHIKLFHNSLFSTLTLKLSSLLKHSWFVNQLPDRHVE